MRPAHNPHNRPLRDAKQQQDRRRGVPGVVESPIPHASSGKEPFPLGVIRARVERSTRRSREQPATIRPQLCRLVSILLISSAFLKFIEVTVGGSVNRAGRFGLRTVRKDAAGRVLPGPDDDELMRHALPSRPL